MWHASCPAARCAHSGSGVRGVRCCQALLHDKKYSRLCQHHKHQRSWHVTLDREGLCSLRSSIVTRTISSDIPLTSPPDSFNNRSSYNRANDMSLRISQQPEEDSSSITSGSDIEHQQQHQPGRPAQDWRVLVALCTLSVVICYADRSNMSTAILPMAEHFGWDKAFQGLVLSSFFAGYAATQVLGGSLADRYGGKLVLASGVALWSLFTCLTPSAAATSTAALLAARVLLGVGEGVAFPAIHSIIARNVPVTHQSSAVGVVTAASYAGTALAFGASPSVISHYGWPAVFYGFGAMALLWLPLWLPVDASGQGQGAASGRHMGANAGPASTAAAAAGRGTGLSSGQSSSYSTLALKAGSSSDSSRPSALPPPPQAGGQRSKHGASGLLGPTFWQLLRAREVQAICVAQYTQSWGMYGLLTWLPTFFSDYYHVQLADLAGYTLLPYVLQGTVGAAAGVLADRLIQAGWSVKSVRRWLQIISMLGPAACLLLAVSPLVGPSPEVASAMITVGLGLSALSLGGVSTSHLDVAPNNAGLVFGAGNTAATLAGLVSVPVTGLLLQQTNSWPLVFGVTALHYAVGAALWAMWLGDKQLAADAAAAKA